MALIAHWPLDGRLDDVSGNGHKLKPFKNFCRFVFDSDCGSMVLEGSGTSDSLDTETLTTNNINFKKFTVMFWLKSTITGASSYSESLFGNKFGNTDLVGNDRDMESRTLNIYRYPNEYSIHTSMYKNPRGSGHKSTANNLSLLNRWDHVTITDDGVNRRIIKNGVTIDNIATEGIFEVIRNDYPISIMIKDSRMRDVRLFNHVVGNEDIKKIIKEPYVDLDFKGTIPPTVNWLDSLDKSIPYIPDELGGSVVKNSPNSFTIRKRDAVKNSISFKPPFKTFTVSFKIRVIDGCIRKIGGHCRWNGGEASIPAQYTSVIINNVHYNYPWYEPTDLENDVNKGGILEVKLSFNLPTSPTWESDKGMFIQPNRGMLDPEFKNLDYELYDVQIEEGLIATPFCTWSRNYMEIPDKSSYRKSIINTESANQPTLFTDRRLELGSSYGLDFNGSKKRITLESIKPLPIMTMHIVYKLLVPANNFNTYLFNIRPMDSTVEFIDRVSLHHQGLELKLMIGTRTLPITTIEVNRTYLVSIVFTPTEFKAYVDGKFINRLVDITTPINLEYPMSIGATNSASQSSQFLISDFKIFPFNMSDEEIMLTYKTFNNNIKSFAGAFDNIPTLNVEVPRLWERNPNTIGIDCFANNPNIPETQAIPIGWGGAFKQPDTSILSVGTTTDMLVTNPEEVIYIDPFLDSVPLHTLLIEDTQTNTESNLTLIKKSKF